MAILYALVARGTTVLAEYTAPNTNIPTVTRNLLQKIDRSSTQKMSVVHGRYVFHYCASNSGLVFLCMAEEASKRRLPFAFLDDAKERFLVSLRWPLPLPFVICLCHGHSHCLSSVQDQNACFSCLFVFAATVGDVRQQGRDGW